MSKSEFEDYEDYEEYRKAQNEKSGEYRRSGSQRTEYRDDSREYRDSSRRYRDDSREYREYRRSGYDRRASGYDRRESGYDHRGSGYDRGESGYDYRPRRRHNVLLIFLAVIGGAVLAACAVFALLSLGGKKVKSIMGTDADSRIEVSTAADPQADSYRTLALFGVDSVEGELDSGNNRSDIIMIMAINNSTGEAKLCSVYRDTYLDIGDGTLAKANAAYAYGGPTQAVNMLNRNLDLGIRDYVTIGFGGISDIIDALGGVEIEIEEDEISFLNDYQSTMAQELGKEYIPVTSAGLQTLTGLQATAYCRIRYTSGDDFKRTERQRTVLSQTFSKLKNAGASDMISLATKLLGNKEIVTSLSMTEMMDLASGAQNYSIGETAGFPGENFRKLMTVDQQSCIVPSPLDGAVTWLHGFLYGTENYEPSDTVKSISAVITAKAG